MPSRAPRDPGSTSRRQPQTEASGRRYVPVPAPSIGRHRHLTSRVRALFDAALDPEHELLPALVLDTVTTAHIEFSDHGLHLPRHWPGYEPLDPTTTAGGVVHETSEAVVRRLPDTLDTLIGSSTDLVTVPRYDRARTELELTLDDLRQMGPGAAARQAALRATAAGTSRAERCW